MTLNVNWSVLGEAVRVQRQRKEPQSSRDVQEETVYIFFVLYSPCGDKVFFIFFVKVLINMVIIKEVTTKCKYVFLVIILKGI